MVNKVYLIGDTIDDITTTGTAIGLSAETPTITMRSEKTVCTPGGAAFVAKNFDALGVEYKFLTNVTARCKSVSKHRFWVDGYKLFQVNSGPSEPISVKQEDMILSEFNPKDGDLVVFSDYRHGLITKRLVSEITSRIFGMDVAVFVDSQVSKHPSNHDWYINTHYMFTNLNEQQYIPKNFLGKRVIKRGENGAEIQYPLCDKYNISIGGTDILPVDTCGAGDAFLAAFVAFHHLGDKTALFNADKWAAMKCTIPNMGVPNLADL